jgi:rod shape-determining protein MreD
MFAALVQGPVIRLVPVGMVLLALQRTFFVEVTVAGVVIQILTAFAAACGAAGGSESGALAGFTMGLMWDLAEGGPLGATSIAMAMAGIVAGLLALITVDPQWWLAALFTGLGTAAGEIMVPVVRFFIGEEDPFVARLWVIVPVVGIAGMVLSPLLVPLARWCFRIKRADWQAVAQAAEAADAT